MGCPVLWALLIAAAFLAGARPAPGQYIAFGKNKVHYTDFRWRVLESVHFRLYYYEEEAELAGQALDLAEASYRVLRGRFAHEVERPIPLIIYSSHQDFEQTNVTPYFLPEGIAGLTEYAKGRVLIPFDGSLHNFRTTIQHELVHVFQLSVLDQVYRENFTTSPMAPPLWFTEGLAVHWSETRDAQADLVLRDLVISGSLPTLDVFWRYDGSYMLYKLGQSVLDYIGEAYGEDRIRLFYERIWLWPDFPHVITDVLGIREEELSERWAHDLKKRYFPEVARAVPATFSSRPLTAGGGADFKPLPLPATLPGLGHHFAFLSPRNGFTNVYTASMEAEEPEKDVRALVAGERHAAFESFHAYRSRMDVSPDGLLLFVSKHRERDEVVVFSVPKRGVVARYSFPDLVGVTSPAWAGGTDRLVFSGLTKDGFSDLYLYDRRHGGLRRLTHDRYQDLDPTFCPWKEAVVWSSDRAVHGSGGARNLFYLDLGTGRIRYLTRGDWEDTAPVWDPETRGLYFASNRDRFTDVYWINEAGDGHRVTQSLDAVLDPRPVPGEHRLLAAVYHGGGFHIRSFPLSDSLGPEFALAAADTTLPWDWRALAPAAPAQEARYRSRFTLDVAQGGVLVDPTLGSGEGVQAALSDMMGNHLIFVGLGNSSFSTSDFFRNFSAGITYVNLSRRLNYGVSAFHYSGDFYDELGLPFFERRVGGSILLSYPLDKFNRVETTASLAYTDTDRPSIDFRRTGAIGIHSVSYVRDTSLWLSTGPIDGQRVNVTAGLTLNLRRGSVENTIALGDVRRYFRLGLYSTYALRLQGRWSQGSNAEVFLLGGSLSLRTYARRAFVGTRAMLVNQEVRFPLMRGLVLGLPMGNVELPGIQGAVFFDTGSAWFGGDSVGWRGATGVGLRMGLGGYLVLRLDVGRQTDFHSFSPTTHTDFYVGWNY